MDDVKFTDILHKCYDKFIDQHMIEIVDNIVQFFPDNIKTSQSAHHQFKEIRKQNNIIMKKYQINTNAIQIYTKNFDFSKFRNHCIKRPITQIVKDNDFTSKSYMVLNYENKKANKKKNLVICPIGFFKLKNTFLFTLLQYKKSSNKIKNNERNNRQHEQFYNGTQIYIYVYDGSGKIKNTFSLLVFDKSNIMITGSKIVQQSMIILALFIMQYVQFQNGITTNDIQLFTSSITENFNKKVNKFVNPNDIYIQLIQQNLLNAQIGQLNQKIKLSQFCVCLKDIISGIVFDQKNCARAQCKFISKNEKQLKFDITSQKNIISYVKTEDEIQQILDLLCSIEKKIINDGQKKINNVSFEKEELEKLTESATDFGKYMINNIIKDDKVMPKKDE